MAEETIQDTTGSTVVTDPGIGLGGPPKDPATGLSGPPADDPAKTGDGKEPPAKEPAKAAPPAPGKEPPAAKVAPKTPTVADGALDPAAAGKEPPAAPPTWPEDWRQQMAGDNKKALTRAERFKTPAEVLNSYLALEAMVSSGEYAKKLPTNPTAQELADFRKANSVPDKAEDYDLNVKGLVWGEADKPMLNSWAQFALENHLPPEIAKLGPLWYAREQENIVERLGQQDADNFQVNTAALQAEWGKEFKPNINAARNLFEGYPGVWEAIMGSRDENGLRGGDNPIVMKALAQISRELNPNATIVPNVPASEQGKTMDARIAELNTAMRNRNGPYWKGPQAAAMQEEYRTLVDRKATFEARTGGSKAA